MYTFSLFWFGSGLAVQYRTVGNIEVMFQLVIDHPLFHVIILNCKDDTPTTTTSRCETGHLPYMWKRTKICFLVGLGNLTFLSSHACLKDSYASYYSLILWTVFTKAMEGAVLCVWELFTTRNSTTSTCMSWVQIQLKA